MEEGVRSSVAKERLIDTREVQREERSGQQKRYRPEHLGKTDRGDAERKIKLHGDEQTDDDEQGVEE